jgi:16S rRNA (cytosine967-C5)-methyltransferase
MLAEQLIEEGLEVEPSALSPLGLTMRRGNPLESRAFERGDFYVQDEVSQVAALIPLPEPGERTLDLAAAPGGKSFAALGWDPELPLLMADASLPRLRKVVENFRRLGRCRPLLVADAGAAPLKAGSFDRVIADLPCSGTGTFRKHPELKWRLSLGELERLARQAERLLAGAAELVAPGGKLVAITCSLEEEENERVVANLRERRADLEPCELEPRLVPPLDRWVEGPGLWRILPADDHDGFTVQVLERREKASGGGSP